MFRPVVARPAISLPVSLIFNIPSRVISTVVGYLEKEHVYLLVGK